MNHFTDGWNAISTREKSVLIAEFLTKNEEDLGYEQWLDFLWRRLCADSTIHINTNVQPDTAHFVNSTLKKDRCHPLEG